MNWAQIPKYELSILSVKWFLPLCQLVGSGRFSWKMGCRRQNKILQSYIGLLRYKSQLWLVNRLAGSSTFSFWWTTWPFVGNSVGWELHARAVIENTQVEVLRWSGDARCSRATSKVTNYTAFSFLFFLLLRNTRLLLVRQLTLELPKMPCDATGYLGRIDLEAFPRTSNPTSQNRDKSSTLHRT